MAWIGAVSDAVDIGQAVADATHRSCTIKIENHSNVYSFAHPKVWMHSGYNNQLPSPTVDINTTEECAFSKAAGAARGAVGVLTYELLKSKSSSNKLLAIMFSVPYDYNLYENWLAVGIFDKTQKCDDTLYNLMYYNSDSKFRRAKATDTSIVYIWESMEIRAAMSNAGTAVVEVEIHDKK
ncbi:DELTA-thalatoxin-Avl1a-like [Chanos chanos]|uniref:DELTA-thalatoxin-Avl1a-like n=1 Tax=Chanos chanos TaxID=29144 RepID=A0A6J2UST8_CHACN|nr:DELTA-thalatoxin-Avl1a-like [Chanos chanos]